MQAFSVICQVNFDWLTFYIILGNSIVPLDPETHICEDKLHLIWMVYSHDGQNISVNCEHSFIVKDLNCTPHPWSFHRDPITHLLS